MAILRLAFFFPPIINRRNVSMISLQWLRGMEVFPTISPPKAAVEHTAQWTFRSGSSCMVQREEKQTNFYPRLSRNEIPPRVLEHRGQSFPHDPVLWFLSFHSLLSNTKSKRKGSNVVRMLPSAGVSKKNAGFFPTWLPFQCCVLLGWDFRGASIRSIKIRWYPGTLDLLLQNHASLPWDLKGWKITAKFWIVSTFIWIFS